MKNRNREFWYKRAIINNQKKINFLQLFYEYQNEYITESQYLDIINKHSEKYTVLVEDIKLNLSDFKIINNIVNEIKSETKQEFSVDDVADIFGITDNAFEKLVDG